MMIYYFYHLNYNTSLLDTLTDGVYMDEGGTARTDPAQDVHMDEKEEPVYKEERLTYEAPIDIPRLAMQRPSDLVVHAKVYGLAEKYLIGGLKDLAVKKFKTAAQKECPIDSFFEAAEEVYTSTIDTDRGLRDVVVTILYNHKQMLDHGKSQTALKTLDALTYDLLMYVYRESGYWH